MEAPCVCGVSGSHKYKRKKRKTKAYRKDTFTWLHTELHKDLYELLHRSSSSHLQPCSAIDSCWLRCNINRYICVEAIKRRRDVDIYNAVNTWGTMSHSDWEHHSSLTVMENTYLILQQNIDVFCFGTSSFWSSVEKKTIKWCEWTTRLLRCWIKAVHLSFTMAICFNLCHE